MRYVSDGSKWLLRFDKGDMLVQGLAELIEREGIKGAWINGLGAAQWVELGFYELDKRVYTWKKLNQLLEITSLQGNVAWHNDKPILHIHGTFSDVSMQAIGGHIKELSVGGTCEVMLQVWNQAEGLARRSDTESGLTTLDIS